VLPARLPGGALPLALYRDEAGCPAVLCVEGLCRPGPPEEEPGWTARFEGRIAEQLESSYGSIVLDRWFVGRNVVNETFVVDLRTLRLRQSPLPADSRDGYLVWEAWFAGDRARFRRLLDALWRCRALRPGRFISEPCTPLAFRETDAGTTEVLTHVGVFARPNEPPGLSFDRSAELAPVLAAWELQAGSPGAVEMALETLLAASDAAPLLPALRARIRRRVASSLLRHVRGRATNGLLGEPGAVYSLWQDEWPRIERRTLEAMSGSDPAEALLATRGAALTLGTGRNGELAWRRPAWNTLVRLLAHPDGLVRAEALQLADAAGLRKRLEAELAPFVLGSDTFREDVERSLTAELPLSTRVGRALARASWLSARESPFPTTLLRYAPWDIQAAFYAGFVDVRDERGFADERDATLVKSAEDLGLPGVLAAFDGMALGITLGRVEAAHASPGPAAFRNSFPRRLREFLEALVVARASGGGFLGTLDRDGKGGLARHALALLHAPGLSAQGIEACLDTARGHGLLPEAEIATLAPIRTGGPSECLLEYVARRARRAKPAPARLCLALFAAYGAEGPGSSPRKPDGALPSGERISRDLPLHRRLALVGRRPPSILELLRPDAGLETFFGLAALLTLASVGDPEALAAARGQEAGILERAPFLEDDGALDALLQR
jgi:hypothetical protein